MKRLLLLYIFLALLNPFSADASKSSAPQRAASGYIISSDSIHAASEASRLRGSCTQEGSFVKKDAGHGFAADFHIKRKATELEYAALSVLYRFTNKVFEFHGASGIYGLTNLYCIKLHSYLHRYQLF